MSLINDALKRASQSDRDRRAQPQTPRLMQPVATPQRTGGLLVIVTVIVVTLGLVLTGWIIWKSPGATRPIAAAAPVPPPVAAVPPPAPNPVASPAETKSSPSPLTTAPAPTPVIATPPARAADDWPTNLIVKAIFYSKSNPRALVNGKTVATGDSIDGVLVTGIMPDRVFVDYKGRSKVILMNGQ